MPSSACRASSKPAAKLAAPWQSSRRRSRPARSSSPWSSRTPSSERSSPSGGTRRSARIESSRRSRSEPGTAAASARSSASSGGAAARTRWRWSRSQPSRAARPSSPGSDSPRASCSKKSLIRFFSVSRSISSIFLSATAVWFATARARSTSEVPSAARRPSSSSFATSGTATDAERPLRASSGPSSDRPISRGRLGARRRGCAQVEHLGRGVEQVEVARLGAQELARARRDRREHRFERLGPGERLAQLGQVLELVDALGASPRRGGRSRSRRRRARRSRRGTRPRPP